MRITRIGLYVNLGMAVGKGVGGYVFNSQGKVYRRNGETPAILTDYSAYCRRHPQLDGSCQRRHDAGHGWVVTQAPLAAISQRLRKGGELGLARCERYPAGGRLPDGLVCPHYHHAAVLP